MNEKHSTAIEMALENAKYNDRSLPADLLEMDWVIDIFVAAMRTKLIRKAREGYTGGLEPENQERVYARLLEHVDKSRGGMADGQEVDIANLAMMLWGSRWREKAKAASTQESSR